MFVSLLLLLLYVWIAVALKTTVEMLKDQALVSAEYISRQNQQCDMLRLCTELEMDVAPICGSDGRTYNSLCEIKKAVCHGNPVAKKLDGPCPAKSKCKLERAFQESLVLAHNKTASSLFIPECEQDGSYSIVQCHHSTGYCWCVTQTGRPLPGTSVQFKRPNCLPYGKVGRRTPRRRLGRPRGGCNTIDRSTFNANLIKLFRSEFERDRHNRIKTNTRGLLISLEKRVIAWKFNQLDGNNDNRLSRREIRGLKRLVRKLVQPRPCARRFSNYCDLDHDRKISRREWFTCLGVDINIAFKVFASLSSDLSPGAKPLLSSRMQQDDAVPLYWSLPPGNLNGAAVYAPPHKNQEGFLLRERPAEGEGEQEEGHNCMSHRQKALKTNTENVGSGVYVPECTGANNKKYARVQCHKTAQYCWCANPETGKPLPGSSVQFGKPVCDTQSTNTSRNIKGCKPVKKERFYSRLHAQLQSSMIASGTTEFSDRMSTKEQAVRWKFTQMDVNKNGKLERKEWKVYRREMKSWHGVKKCGRNFMRYCDKGRDKKITIEEWMECTMEFPIPRRHRKGPNPFETILNPN